MSRENVELALSLYRAGERQDASAFASLDEKVHWDMRGLGMPDLARVYRGRSEVARFWADWLAAWENIEFLELRPEDRGEHVIVEVLQRVRGRVSGAEVKFHYWQTFSFRDGSLTASHLADTRSDALEAVELRE
jgi:ketosteroid isomerase-like protein